MTDSNTLSSSKSTSKSEIQELIAAQNAKIAARKAELELESPQLIQEDPLEAARASSPLLQYLVKTKDLQLATLPDVEIEPIPDSLFNIELNDNNIDEWNKNLQQAVDQIKALGYVVGDRVPIRLLPAKGLTEDIRERKNIGRAKSYDLEILENNRYKLTFYKWVETDRLKADGTPFLKYVRDPKRSTFDWWRELIKQNSRGFGVYLAPNKGGHVDKDTTHWQSAFFEVDDRSLSQQQSLVDDFVAKTGVKPSVVVRTRKSLHVYFKFLRSEWELPNWTDEVQKPTIFAFQSDPSIVNNAQLMRLAGFYHVKYDKFSDEFDFLKCELQVCEPERRYTRSQYRKALAEYSGTEYSEEKLKLIKDLYDAQKSEYFYLEADYGLMPTINQVMQCPDELVKELSRRTNAYIGLLRREHNVAIVDPTEAWIKPLEELAIHQNTNLKFDDSEESFSLRWAQYLYGYDPDGRPGWITGQDPTIPEDERDEHSLNSLHINKETGKYKSHRGTSTKEIFRALKELAFKSNPEEEKFWKARMSKAKAQSRKQQGEISKAEYKAQNLKPELSELEKYDKVIDLQQAQDAKEARKNRELADYLARLAIDNKRVSKFYECNERYLSDKTFDQFPTIAECERRGQMLALKSPKGTGKSKRIKQYIKEAQKACWLTVSVTIRRNLGLAQAHEWGIKWVDEDGMESFFQGNSNTMSCCWDSLHKFYKADYRNKSILLIVDEVESGLDHMVSSDTIKQRGNRVDIYAELRRLVDHIATHGGLIIAADADLSNDSLEYFHTIGNQLPVTVISNNFVDKKKHITVFYGKEGQVRNAIKDAIEMGIPFLVGTDSIKELEKLHGYAKKFLEEINLPEQLDKLWLIDGETSGTDANRERLKDINTAIKKESPIAIFFTPSINVGVSIDVQYFCEGFALFKGSITADSARQMIARNREFIPWTIFADNTAKKQLLSQNTPITPKAIKKGLLETLEDQVALTSHIAQKLLTEGQEQDSENIALARLELARQLKTDKTTLDTAEFHLLANITAKKNFQYKYYHDCFVAGMEGEGWTVTTKKGTKTAFCDELKEIREKQMKAEAEAIAVADHSQIPDYETAKSILSTEDDRELRRAAYKVCVAHWTGVEVENVDAELVALIKFNPRWLAGVKFQHYLENEEVVREIDARKVNKMAKDYAKHQLTALNDYTGVSPVVAAILDFGLLDVIDLHDDEQTFMKEDFAPLLKKFKNYGTERLKEYFRKFGIELSNRYIFEDPIRLAIRPMLAKMNYTIQEAKKNSKGQKSYRIPAEEINCLNRARVLEGLKKKQAEIKAQRELQLTAVTMNNLEQDDLTPALEQVDSELVPA